MFVRAPDGFNDRVMFIFDPDQIGRATDPDSPYGICTSVLLPHRTKHEIDQFFAEFLGFGPRKVRFGFNKTYGEIIVGAYAYWHSHGGQRDIITSIESTPASPNFAQPETCSLEDCPCKFDEENFWLHFTFHRLLENIGNYVGDTKESLIGNINTLIQEPTYEYIREYGYSVGQNNLELPDFGGSVEFVLKSIITNYTDNFKLGDGATLARDTLLDERAFDDCKRGKHDYIYRKMEWESKSVEGPPMFPDHPASIGTSTQKRRGTGEISPFTTVNPLARIDRVECSCSRRHYVFELNSYPAAGRRNLIARREPGAGDQEAIENLLFKYFEGALPRAQAEVAAKLFYSIHWESKNTPLESRERQAKKLLRNKLDKLSATVMLWPDLRELYQKLQGHG